MHRQGLLQNLDFLICKGAVAAGATDVTDAVGVDMQNHECVTFVASVGAITAGAATSLRAQQSSDNGSADAYADLEGSGVTILDTEDDRLVILEVVKPKERWVKPIFKRATQNSVLNGIWAVRSGAKNVPRSQSTSHVIAASKTLVSPNEGTA